MSTIRVVCIEDEPEMIDLVRLILSRKQNDRVYEVYGAHGGEEGLRITREILPDLVLLDLMMPGMDGWEVYQHMKNDELMHQIPVIILTAKAQSIDEVLATHIAKVNAYVIKPFTPHDLTNAIERVLREQGKFSA